MEEIEVGEYVRYNGEIHKIEQIGNTMFWVENGLAIEIEQTSFNQYKHSKNIIDLIEVGDLCIIDEDIVYIYDEGFINAVRNDIENGDKLISIVTREQLENNCYRLEE